MSYYTTHLGNIKIRNVEFRNRRLYEEDPERRPKAACENCIYYDDPNYQCDDLNEICDDFRERGEEE